MTYTLNPNLLTYRESIGDIEGVAALKNVSLVAWQHINLHCRYEFTKNTDPIDMNEIIRVLAGFRSERFRTPKG